MRREGGLTLIELVVVMGLFVLLTVLLGGFLRDLARSSGSANVRAGLQTEALLHSEDMLGLLRQTTLTGLSVRGDGPKPGFGATPLKSVTNSGQRVWDSKLVMYYWAPESRVLYLQSSPPASLPAGLSFQPARPPAIEPDQLDAMLSGGRPLSNRVVAFDVRLNDDRLTLRLALEQTVKNAPTQHYEVQREMTILSP